MSEQKEGKLIDITGRLPKPKLEPGQAVEPGRVQVGAKDDRMVDLTLRFMKCITEGDWTVLEVLTALSLAVRVVTKEYAKRFGGHDLIQKVMVAQNTAQQYEAVFHEQRDGNGGSQGGGPPEGNSA